jgi:hypothetical protein
MQLGPRRGGHSIHRASAHINSSTTRRAVLTDWSMRRARSRCSTTPCEPRSQKALGLRARSARRERPMLGDASSRMGTGLPLLRAQQPLRHAIGRRPLRTAPPRVQSNSAGEGAGVTVAGGGADPTRCSPTDCERHFRVRPEVVRHPLREWWWWVLGVLWCWAAGAYIPPTGF